MAGWPASARSHCGDDATIAVLIVVVVVAAIIMRFISEGALIEGIVRARQGVAMTVREGFRAGWSHGESCCGLR